MERNEPVPWSDAALPLPSPPLPRRAASVLQRAMASVPLASDPGGDPLDIVFEDEHFLAVNKPVGLHTAPIHRFTGPSVRPLSVHPSVRPSVRVAAAPCATRCALAWSEPRLSSLRYDVCVSDPRS